MTWQACKWEHWLEAAVALQVQVVLERVGAPRDKSRRMWSPQAGRLVPLPYSSLCLWLARNPPACSLTPFISSTASGSPLRMRCATSTAVPAGIRLARHHSKSQASMVLRPLVSA